MVESGDEIRIEEVNVNNGNIKFGCKCVNSDHIYNIDWYKTRGFVKSKSDIREEKLNELGIWKVFLNFFGKKQQ